MATTLDTLGYMTTLRDAGVDQKQAEAMANAARDHIMPELVTKSDLKAALDLQTIRIGGMMAIAVGILTAIIKLT